ncbi:MAG TPA: YdiU family protein [Aestuariivirga sp.]
MHTPLIEQSYAALPELLYTRVEPQIVAASKLVIANDALAAELGIDRDWLHSADALQLLAGNAAPPHGSVIAMAYAGHQFGGFNARLGDGRALLLGDVVLNDGTRRELHLKGSGRTIYSRGGDGRATLSAMLREYILSEAMAALAVPTTRSLAVVETGERVFRQRPERGAVLTRVAKSHVRVGTFQFLAARGETKAIEALMAHEIARAMPNVSGAREFLAEVLSRQARLIAQWMSFGFIHGVMNTDNAQIAGETIDYGPCAFMDGFDPQKVFSSIDENGRYAYDKQPMIGLWNMTRLAECLLPLLDENREAAIKIAEAELGQFMPLFEAEFEKRMLAKLGIIELSHAQFITKTLLSMANARADFTRFFTALTRGDDMKRFFSSDLAHDEWLAEWNVLRARDATALMQKHNPVYIARNHRVEAALGAAEDENYLPLHQLLSAVQNPFTARADLVEFENAPDAQEEVLQTFCGT